MIKAGEVPGCESRRCESQRCSRYDRCLPKSYRYAVAAAVAIFVCGCAKPPNRIVVGSQNGTAQIIVGEIVAQHLEHRMARKIPRMLGAGTEQLVYQSMLEGEVSLYPSFTGSIETVILKIQPSSDPAIVWERAHSEMDRIGKMELFNPLGYENAPAMVVRTADVADANVGTLSQAATGTARWKIALSYEFQQRVDSIPAITSYKLPLAQAMRGMEAQNLFPALDRGDVNMIAADSTDSHLSSPDYRVLVDDKHSFPPYQACLLVRQDALKVEPQLRTYLTELTGKFTTEAVRKMSALVDHDHRTPADVATGFLEQSGLR